MTIVTGRCEQSWSVIRNNCCGECVCSPTSVYLTPVHCPSGDVHDGRVYGVFSGVSDRSNGNVSSALAISANKVPLWETEFFGQAQIVADTLGISLDDLTPNDFIDHIERWLNLNEPDENASIEKQEQWVINQAILDSVRVRLNSPIGNRGKLWYFKNDDTHRLWWKWVCYDDMLTSRFDKTNVLHKYTRLTEDTSGRVAYERHGVSRHEIDNLGPCDLYSTVNNPYGGSSCFFSPHKFLHIRGNDLLPLRLVGTITEERDRQDEREIGLGGSGVSGYNWHHGRTLFDLSELPTGGGENNNEDNDEDNDEAWSVTDRRVEVMLPPQLYNIIISNPYNFCFTPKYLEFTWTRHDLTCRKYNEEGELVSCTKMEDGCQHYLGSYYEAWTGSLEDIYVTSFVQREIVDHGGRPAIMAPNTIIGSLATMEQMMASMNMMGNVGIFFDMESTFSHQNRLGVWGNINAIMNNTVYFNCENRWANIKITDYPIQPIKKVWEPGEGQLSVIQNCETDPDTGDEVCEPTGRAELVIEDAWACGDREHIKHLLLGDDVWISTGFPGNEHVRERPDEAFKVIEEAYAYKYKHEVSTHGLLVREAIDEYAPLPDYSDEVEKRNFQMELEERLKEIGRRRLVIHDTLLQLEMRLELLERQITLSLEGPQGELIWAENERNELQARLDVLRDQFNNVPADSDEVRELHREVQDLERRIASLDTRIIELQNHITELSSPPEYVSLKNWIAELKEEDCMLDESCILQRIDDLQYISSNEEQRRLFNIAIAETQGELARIQRLGEANQEAIDGFITELRSTIQTREEARTIHQTNLTNTLNTIIGIETTINNLNSQLPGNTEEEHLAILTEIATQTELLRQAEELRDGTVEVINTINEQIIELEDRVTRILGGNAAAEFAQLEAELQARILDLMSQRDLLGLTNLEGLQAEYDRLRIEQRNLQNEFRRRRWEDRQSPPFRWHLGVDGDPEAREMQDRIDELGREIGVIWSRIRHAVEEIRRLRRELWKFMDEEARVRAEIAEIQEELDELEEEFEQWKEFVNPDGGNWDKNSVTEIDDPDWNDRHITRFGMPSDFCYWMMYTRTINRVKDEIRELEEYLEDAKGVHVLKPYIWEFNTYMWKNKIQEGMAYYRWPAVDEIDPDIKKGRAGWGAGRGINNRTNWDFSWARGYKEAAVEVKRQGIQTSRKSIGGTPCLVHYVEKSLLDQTETIDSRMLLIEQELDEIMRLVWQTPPGPTLSDLMRRFNDLQRDLIELKERPEDATYKSEIEWEERYIPLADDRPYGLVGKTVLKTSGAISPVGTVMTDNQEPEISDWRKMNDPQINHLYTHSVCPSTGVTLYTLKEGADLVFNLVDPVKIYGYTIVKDSKFPWQRRRFRRTVDQFGQSVIEEYWEDDPELEDEHGNVHNEFLVWYDGTSFVQKPYRPETRYGGLLYKMESHKYIPTLSQRSPINAVDTNVEDFKIYNTHFINRRHAYGTIGCKDGLLTITFYDYNYPITNPAPRGQVPFWYGEILFAPDIVVDGETRQYRDMFIALKGDSGWICTLDNPRPLADEIHNFRGFWFNEEDRSYYVKNDYGVGRIVPIRGGIHIVWIRESRWRTPLVKLWNSVLCKWVDNAPWLNPTRAFVFTSHGNVIGKTYTSGSTWHIYGIVPSMLDVDEVYPISKEEEFNGVLVALEERYIDVRDQIEHLLSGPPPSNINDVYNLQDQLAVVRQQIDDIKSQDVKPLVFFNILRPGLQREIRDADIRIAELEDEIAELPATSLVAIARLRRQIESIRQMITGDSRYNICLLIKDIPSENRNIVLHPEVHYRVIGQHDKIKRIQTIDNYVFILTTKGQLFRGELVNDPEVFFAKRCITIHPETGDDIQYGAILDFWMESAVKGRLIFSDMYQRGFTVAIEIPEASETETTEDVITIRFNAIEQPIAKAILDEPYGGTSCAMQLLDSHYDNPSLLLNYRGWLWTYKDHTWTYTGQVKRRFMTASWVMEFDLEAEFKEASNTWDISGVGALANECGLDILDEFKDDIEHEDLPPHNLHYNSVIGDGDFKPEDLIGVINISDLDKIISTIRSAATYGDLAKIFQYAIFGTKNRRPLDNILRGLSATDSNLQFEYIESIRELIFIECIYNKYFYVKSTRSLWLYNGRAWIEFLRFTNGFPVRDVQEFKDMSCFVLSVGATGIPNRPPNPPPANPAADRCCRRCKEEREITAALDAIENDTFLFARVNDINEKLNTVFVLDPTFVNVREIMGNTRHIINDPNHPLHPVSDPTEMIGGQTSAQKIQEIEGILRRMAEFLMQGSINMRKVRYLLNFTYDLIINEVIPLFGEQQEFLSLLAEIDRNRRRVTVSYEGAIEFYNRVYTIAQSMLSNLMFDMSVGDFFVSPKPGPPPECEDPCDCDCNITTFHLGIVDIYHKPSRLIDFVPSEHKDFIIHLDEWSTDYGDRWIEWDNCVGPCTGCRFNPRDNPTILPMIKIADQDDDLWDDGFDLWIFEYHITEGAVSIANSNNVWSTRNEWWYNNWSIRVTQEFFNRYEDQIIDNGDGTFTTVPGIFSQIPNEFYRAEYRNYIYGNASTNDGVWYLMSLGGVLLKDIRRMASAGRITDFKHFYLLLDPPPNMARDNTNRKLDLQRRIGIIDMNLQLRNDELQQAIRLGDSVAVARLEDIIERLEWEREGLQEFNNWLPIRSLYHEDYEFDIMIFA